MKIEFQLKIGNRVLEIFNSFPDGKIIALSGESGVGKTTFLNILAGLIKPEKGEIEVEGKIFYSFTKKIFLPPQKRDIGYLFQDYALFPNMTLLENLLFVNQNLDEITPILKIMELEKLTSQYPKTLSGGQKQRVALARVILKKPKLMLLDEPFSALDWKMRERLQDMVLEFQQKNRISTFLISHDFSEVQKMADEVFEFPKDLLL